ncbi:MAG: hypothetical protein JO287_22785, partial [Pseudonocardiales bacterium]|nr:hypothetical protein [Pseudonocardiales bacterium]
WPAFVALTIVDAVIGHLLPLAGQTETLVGAGLAALVLNLLAVILLSRPFGALLRTRREDLPAIVARDYAGTAAIVAISAGLLAAGLVHRGTILQQQRTMRDAIVRAQAWIGDRAPPEFRRNLAFVSTFTIQTGSIYRTCVPSDDRRRSFCVIVKTYLPFAQSVSFAGYEPNSVFAEGAS